MQYIKRYSWNQGIFCMELKGILLFKRYLRHFRITEEVVEFWTFSAHASYQMRRENYIFLSCIRLVTLQLFRLSGRTHKSIFFMMITYPLCSVDIIFLLFLKIKPKISACFCPKQTPFINFIDFCVFFFLRLFNCRISFREHSLFT